MMPMKKKDKQEEEMENTGDTKEANEDMKKKKETDDEYDEEDNAPPKKSDMDETKQLVQEAIKDFVKDEIDAIPIKDMIMEAVQETLKPICNDMTTIAEKAKEYNDAKVKDLQELLEKEPYGYAKDFLAELPLDKLQITKESFEASKAYKDFVITQEEANKPNTEIFEPANLSDFQAAAVESNWSHIYPSGGNK